MGGPPRASLQPGPLGHPRGGHDNNSGDDGSCHLLVVGGVPRPCTEHSAGVIPFDLSTKHTSWSLHQQETPGALLLPVDPHCSSSAPPLLQPSPSSTQQSLQCLQGSYTLSSACPKMTFLFSLAHCKNNTSLFQRQESVKNSIKKMLKIHPCSLQHFDWFPSSVFSPLETHVFVPQLSGS